MTRLKDIKLGRNQYLVNVISQIEINIILFKFLCGIGATTLELEDKKRSSIIIEPNRPVIEGKCKNYNAKRKQKIILGVYEGVTKDDIIEYLESDIFPKKIMTTPESFQKVKEAMMELDMLQSMYDDYYILFDECERTVQDVGYREKITLPIDDYFKFKSKAFISATPIMPSDPRFAKEGFRIQKVVPTFNHIQDLRLVVTNNTFYSFKRFIDDNPRERYFIFFNSTNAIANLISFLEIKADSAIFCSKESRNKLKLNGFADVYTSLGEHKDYKKFNFLTSRFFSAVDIEHETNPTIIIVTDLVSAEHSMIDPCSESVQIVGRFRKPKVGKIVKEVIHITNVNPDLSSITKEELLKQIVDYENLHRVLRRYYNASDNATVRLALEEMMTRADFAKFINFDGSKNYYMVDNAIHEESIKGAYQNGDNLVKAYKDSKHFKVQPSYEHYEYTDQDRIKTSSTAPLKTTFEIIMPVLKQLFDDNIDMLYREMQISNLRSEYPEVMKVFNKIGLEKAKELQFDPKKIRSYISELEMDSQRSSFKFIQLIERLFLVGQGYSSTQIKRKLQNAIQQCNLTKLKPTITLLREYCLLSDRCWIGVDFNGKNVMGYKVLKIYDTVKGN
ncbi:hypothetical protein [Pedobacter panaciterrae]